MRSEREREEDRDSFTPCQKDSPPRIPEKSEDFLCRAETLTVEAILKEEALGFNKLNGNISFIPTARDVETTAGQRCLSASLPVICSAQVVEHTAKNTEHTLVHSIVSTRLIKRQL